jgi:multiple sugar transport system permease protein
VIGIQGPMVINNEMTVKPAIVAMTVWKGLGRLYFYI